MGDTMEHALVPHQRENGSRDDTWQSFQVWDGALHLFPAQFVGL